MSNKKLVRDILIAVPIGILYILFINKLNQIVTSDLEYAEKIKKSIMINFIASIVGFVLAYKVFGNEKLYNRIIKYALIFGSTLIFMNALLYNWPDLQTDTKAIIFGITLVVAILITYKL
jgi:hypothetical protein